MSTMTLTYFSKALIGCTQINLYLPIGAEYEDMVQAGEKFQVLWLLHGHGGNYSEWARYTCIEKLAMDHKFAVVMPEGGFSFYSDQANGMKYDTYITQELPSCGSTSPCRTSGRITSLRACPWALSARRSWALPIRISTAPSAFSPAAPWTPPGIW